MKTYITFGIALVVVFLFGRFFYKFESPENRTPNSFVKTNVLESITYSNAPCYRNATTNFNGADNVELFDSDGHTYVVTESYSSGNGGTRIDVSHSSDCWCKTNAAL